MKPSTVDMLRAWLLVASLSATLIDAVVLIALGCFGMPERAFESASFRWGVVAAVALTLAMMRMLARLAFDAAIAGRHATVSDSACQIVSISADCPFRLLVLFHVRTHRDRLVPSRTSTTAAARIP